MEKGLAPSPYGLIVEGEGHEYPLPEYQHIEWLLKWGKPFQEVDLGKHRCGL